MFLIKVSYYLECSTNVQLKSLKNINEVDKSVPQNLSGAPLQDLNFCELTLFERELFVIFKNSV